MSGLDEFGEIARLFRPLTGGAAGAFDLLDDAALVSPRAGHELVVTTDAIVAGVHFLPDDAPDLVAKKLLRVNLSDLAAKAAEPFAAFLAVAWPPAYGEAERAAFARGLGEDLADAAVALMGGDTVATPGPLTASLTVLGWVPEGRMVRRAGAKAGDKLLVSGTIGDGALGLKAARGEIPDPDGWLAQRYRLPTPRLDLREPLRAAASAAADVSDGLVADARHVAEAGGVKLILELERIPLSEPAKAWLNGRPDRARALLALATGGDDYEIVCTASRELPGFTLVGEVAEGAGVEVRHEGRVLDPGAGGWRHR